MPKRPQDTLDNGITIDVGCSATFSPSSSTTASQKSYGRRFTRTGTSDHSDKQLGCAWTKLRDIGGAAAIAADALNEDDSNNTKEC
jgi:hypothetical protein